MVVTGSGSPSTETAQAGLAGARLQLIDLTKTYGDVVAADRVTLDIAPGEFITLLGPSGSGKTTTLMMIAGFVTPTSGQILVNGDDIAFRAPHKRNIGMVFQNYALFPHMTVAENIAFPLKMRKWSRNRIQEAVDEVLRLVRLSGYGERYPRQLSGGQQQRVALARALVFRPPVLLMDEPLGALDKKLREEMQLEIKHIQEATNITTVYVTHDQEEALTMSDRIAVMNEGRIEQCDAPVAVYEKPATTFVAGFIGVSNLMPAVVEHVNGTRARVRLDAGIEIEAENNGLQTGDRCHAVVRPEKLRIDARDGTPPDGWPRVDGVVESSVYLGTSTQIVVRLAGDVPMTVLVPNSDERERNRLPGGGADVRLSWAPEHIHLVRESGTAPAAAAQREPETQIAQEATTQ